MADKIDAAIAAADDPAIVKLAKDVPPDTLGVTVELTRDRSKKLLIGVPPDFSEVDLLAMMETIVQLMHHIIGLRLQAQNSGLVVPEKGIVAPNGRRIS